MDHYDCLKPLLYMQQCLGVGSFYVKKQNNFKPHEYYTKKYDFLVSLFFMLLVISGLIVKKYQESDSDIDDDCFLLNLISITSLYETYFGMFLFFITYIMTYKYRYIIMEAHTSIEEIDKTLYAFQYEIPYRKIRNYSTVAVLILILLEFLAIIISSYDTLFDDYTKIIFMLVDCITILVYNISIGSFINFMFCLRYRFRAINNLLERNFKQYVMDNSHSSESERNLKEQAIDTLTKTHETLCDVSNSISDAFSMILFSVLAYLFVLVIIVVFATLKIFILGYTYKNSVWIEIALLLTYGVLIYSLKLGLIVFSTELVISESSKTHQFVHKTINCYNEDSIRNKLTIFLMQLLNRKPTFTACGLFEINLPLLFSMVGTLFTYVIILIQFDQSDAGCIEKYLKPENNSTNLSMEMVANDTISNLMAGLESKIYLNITETLDYFNTNVTNTLMKLIENGKYLTNLSIPTAEPSDFSDLSWKMMNMIQNISSISDLLKNISSDIQNLLLNN